MADSDPSRIRSLAISREDAVDAFVYDRENPATAVLRVTPPFHGRMRARIHVSHERSADEVWKDSATDSIHLDPEILFEPAIVEAYPVFEDFYASQEESTDGVRERYERRLEEWRMTALDGLVDAVVLDGNDSDDDGSEGSHRVDVKWLE